MSLPTITQAPSTIHEKRLAEAVMLRFQILNIEETLGKINNEITALSQIVEASEAVSSDSIVVIKRQAEQIHDQLQKIGLQGCDASLALLETAIQQVKEAISRNQTATERADGFIERYGVRHQESKRSRIQSIQGFANCIKYHLENMPNVGANIQEIDPLLQMLLEIRCKFPEYEEHLNKMKKSSHLTEEDRAFLMDTLPPLLSECEDFKELFRVIKATCRTAVEAADNAHNAVQRQLEIAKNAVAKREGDVSLKLAHKTSDKNIPTLPGTQDGRAQPVSAPDQLLSSQLRSILAAYVRQNEALPEAVRTAQNNAAFFEAAAGTLRRVFLAALEALKMSQKN